ITVNDVSHSEGDTGTTTFAVLTVSLSVPATNPVSVNYETEDGTATIADGDYASTGGTLTFDPGETAKTISIAVAGDDIDESDETVRLRLSAAVGGTISDVLGVVTITDDDEPGKPDIVISDASALEGDSGTTAVTLTVSLSHAHPAVTVKYETSVGSATQADFQPTSGTLVFLPVEISKTITVQVIGDTIDESDETFTVNLSDAPNGNITDAQGVVTIIDDDREEPTPTPTPTSTATPTPTETPVETPSPTTASPSPGPSLPTSPPTDAPPTDAPPTDAPPTDQPPTIEPTRTPPVESPAPTLNPPPESPLPSGGPVPPGTGDDDPLDELVAPGIEVPSGPGPRDPEGRPRDTQGVPQEPTIILETASPETDRPANFADLLIETAQALTFPLFLVILVILFLLVQSRIDRDDPKLAHAPTHNDFLEFV
ncbi:MAG: Calx-beta domain-containing protein, partial [Actinomycetota bacterium]